MTSLETHVANASVGSRSVSVVDLIGALEAASPAPSSSAFEVVKKLLLSGIPLSLATMSQSVVPIVIITVIGHLLGVKELGGVALALGLINAVGFAISTGFCGALETVLSHTFGMYKDDAARQEGGQDETGSGRQKHNPMYIYGTYAQRMTVILLVVSIPAGLVLLFSERILRAIGQTEDAIGYTGLFCRVSVLGLPGVMLLPLIIRYFTCQEKTGPVAAAGIICGIANPLLQLSFVKMFGFVGSPIAWVLLFTGESVGLVLYLYLSKIYKLTWGGWDMQAVSNLGPLLRLALPSMGMMFSEWMVMEINSIAAGFAPEEELAAFSISTQVFGIMWSIASGPIILACVFVGNAIGKGQPEEGRRIALICMLVVLGIAVLNSCIVFLLLDYVAYLFTTDPVVLKRVPGLLYWLLPYHLVDTFQSTVLSILRGCALQKIGALIICVALCVVGVPFGFFLFFGLHYSVEALWIGPFTGVLVAGVPSYLYLFFFRIDWPNLKPHRETPVEMESRDVVLTAEVQEGFSQTRVADEVDGGSFFHESSRKRGESLVT